MNKRTVFVTGGTGRVGQHLVSRLVSYGFYVKVLTRRKNFSFNNREGNVQVIEGDILDQDTVKKEVRGCEYLFHLAVYQDINEKNKKLFQRVNVEGTKAILNAAVNSIVKKIVYVSTAMVFESTGKIERDEGWKQRTFSEDNYFQTKIEALFFVRQMKRVLPIVVAYPSLVIDLKNFYSSMPVRLKFWQKFLWKKIGGGIPGGLSTFIGLRERILNYVVIDDLVEGIIKAAMFGRAGEEYILGGDNITVENYIRAAFKRVNKKPLPVRIPIYFFKIISRCIKFLSKLPVIKLILIHCQTDMCFSSEKARKFLGYDRKSKL